MDGKPIISRLDIVRYRGINGLSLNNLSKVNILTGTNNCGKTSVLEAITLLGGAGNMNVIVSLIAQRALAQQINMRRHIADYMLTLFQNTDETFQRYILSLGADVSEHYYSYDIEGNIKNVVKSSGEAYSSLEMLMRLSADGNQIDLFEDEIANGQDREFKSRRPPIFLNGVMFRAETSYSMMEFGVSSAIKIGNKARILHILRMFDNDIQDISVIGDEVYLDHAKKRPLPLFSYGVGTQKAVLLASFASLFSNGVFCVDEIDNAIHTLEFEPFFGWFLDACIEYNIQAFLTTHSAEALDAFLRVAHRHHKDEDLLRVITLRKDEQAGVTRSVVRTGEEAYEDRTRFRQELRV